MTTIRAQAERYLAARRRLGFKLDGFDTLLWGFVSYLEDHDTLVVTTDAAVAWAKATPRSTSPVRWSRRMLVARLFARHLNAIDPVHQVPPPDILNHYYCRRVPHVHTAAEVAALMAVADGLAPVLRGLTYQTLIGLGYVTGMRAGELRALSDPHVDLDQGVIHVVDAKFGKSRDVPLHPATVEALASYQRRRDQVRPNRDHDHLFINTTGRPLTAVTMNKTFSVLIQRAGLPATLGHRPRFHDLRHSLAIDTLTGWYERPDCEPDMPALATFLGHADPKSTYWYLTGTPELMALAADRLETITEAKGQR